MSPRILPFIKVIVLLPLLTLSILSKAQFEQKITLQASGGYVEVLSPDLFKQDVFDRGFSIDAGMQYNFSRSFSLAALAKYSRLFNPAKNEGIWDDEYNLIGLTICPKYRLLPRYKVNPYLYGGLSVNYVNIIWEKRNAEGTFEDVKSPLTLGLNGGLGIDIRVSDNLSLFVQGGFLTTKYTVPDYTSLALFYWDEYWEWINFTYFQAGINISLFKSKSL
jgi:hypothetical protein